ncbi:electron transporter RnfG [Pseudomonas sp. S35]|uniref:RnfABCDGE type electron transport complex subunit G n=1 Tax=Pseudomonas sp. S35 TaxID=1573719 RepID=UPI00132EA018|nr:RnfABCDGE type electron transport complex subunit G [Pseudomonas sp. S35]QHF43466.1 electron transporter RnfG [Pseudomonas sp. S35]
MKNWIPVALTAILGIALTLGLQHLTVDYAARQAQAQQRQALLDLLPSDSYDNQPLDKPLATDEPLTNSQLRGGYLATLAGQPSAVLLQLKTTGYAGPIELLIAIGNDGRLVGVKVLQQSETPSLGGHIGEPGNPWMAAFKGRTREDPAQFDQMAGATVTSHAVIDAVHDALRYFDEHRASLLEPGAYE